MELCGIEPGFELDDGEIDDVIFAANDGIRQFALGEEMGDLRKVEKLDAVAQSGTGGCFGRARR